MISFLHHALELAIPKPRRARGFSSFGNGTLAFGSRKLLRQFTLSFAPQAGKSIQACKTRKSRNPRTFCARTSGFAVQKSNRIANEPMQLIAQSQFSLAKLHPHSIGTFGHWRLRCEV
jgi:hypothetical protein